MMTPFRPRIRPRRMPASSSGRAARKTIREYRTRFVAPNERPISTSEGLTRSTPTWVSSAITQTENRNTVTIIVSSPKPSSAISAGTIAVSGELSKMFTHIPITEPTARLVPIRMPTPMPMAKDRPMPMRKACSVIHAASANVDDDTTSEKAAITSVNGGRSDTRSSRPTTSHMANHTSSENAIGIRWPRSSMSALQVAAELVPDLLDPVEVGGAAPDLVGAAAPVDTGANDLRDPRGAPGQDDDLVGDVDGLLDRMGHEDHGLALLAEQPQQVVLELAADLLVDGREGLVHQQDVGVHRERPGESDALAHPAGELVGVGVLEAREPHLVDIRPRGVLALLAGQPAQLQAEGDVAQHRRPRHQGEILEHERPVRPGTRDRDAVDLDPSRRRVDQSGHDLQRRGLTAAAGADDAGELAPGHVEGEAAQGADPAGEVLDEVDDADGGLSKVVGRGAHTGLRGDARPVGHRALNSGRKRRFSRFWRRVTLTLATRMIDRMAANISG